MSGNSCLDKCTARQHTAQGDGYCTGEAHRFTKIPHTSYNVVAKSRTELKANEPGTNVTGCSVFTRTTSKENCRKCSDKQRTLINIRLQPSSLNNELRAWTKRHSTKRGVVRVDERFEQNCGGFVWLVESKRWFSNVNRPRLTCIYRGQIGNTIRT